MPTQRNTDLSLSPEHALTHIALDDGWGPTPPTVHTFLKEMGCFNKHNKMIVMDFLSMVSLREKEKIHDIKVYSGWTCVISVRALIQAKKQAMEGFADYQEIELDPAVEFLWREKYGDNWREKRRQEMARDGGGQTVDRRNRSS